MENFNNLSKLDSKVFDNNLFFYTIIKMLIKCRLSEKKLLILQEMILPRDRNHNNILAFKQSILCSKDLVRVDSVYRSEFETLIDIVSADNIELWKLFCDISIDLLLIKDLIIQESKAFIVNRVKDNISKISDKLSLNYDLSTLQLPYALRVATTLLSFAVTGIERESSFIISNSNDIVKKIKSKVILMRDQYGINVSNIYSLIINESVNQSIKSDAGSSYETRFNEMISPIADFISGHCHDKNIKSVEYDFVFKINDIKIGVSAKRTLRERYKQNFEDVSGLDVDYMLLATLGTDLNEEKLNNILQRNHIYVLVADEVYKSRGFMQKTNMVISSDNISREKFESIFVKY